MARGRSGAISDQAACPEGIARRGSICGNGCGELLGLGLDRHAGGDGAGGKDVGSQAAVADESFEGVGFGEALQVCAGLTEMLAEVLDVANEEPASDKVVQIDTSGDDVAAGVG